MGSETVASQTSGCCRDVIKNQIKSHKISYKNVTHSTLIHVLFLRVKQVNPESLEEMECPAKTEFLDYQGSRCMCLFVSVRARVLCAVFLCVLSMSSCCNLLFRALLDLQASWV